MFRQRRLTPLTKYADDVEIFVAGLKRIYATRNQSGAGKAKMAGKMTLPCSAYAHWNMICTLQSAKINHIWHLCNEDNSVSVVFHKNKANQNGTGSKDPRYLHANPLSPSLCCITALGYAELVAHGMGPVHVLQALSGATAFGRVLVVHWVNKTANKTMERNLLEKMCRRMHAMKAPVARHLSTYASYVVGFWTRHKTKTSATSPPKT
ncbi:hypothetical protein PHMEG_00032387 [Phytophthora megakarya]|uniref:Uncharacterized protein n=1 Tax=Phytophthora megakarya TaxID=4795 RepID=A0A225UX97_9STRA|nr:hypothetical protein PHMEG_00032387 [Phytophthora megakarya]